MCCHCNNIENKKADCLCLSSTAVREPAPSTLRITDDQQGKAEAPVMKSHFFQLTTKEVRAVSNVVISVCVFVLYLLWFSLFILIIFFVVIRNFPS